MTTFNKVGMSSLMAKQKAEMYMDIYQYIAEDFSAVSDSKLYEQKVETWGNEVERKLTALGGALRKHTHPITPHTHIIPPHSHPETPHIHVSGAPGSNTSPQIGSYSTGMSSTPETLPNTILDTQVANNAPSFTWRRTVVPSPAVNTTGAISNITQNKIIIRVDKEGTPKKQRAKLLAILKTPEVPPNLAIAATI